MMLGVVVLAAAQLQTMHLPPSPVPVTEAPSRAGEVTGLPDLVIGGIRIADDTHVQIEIRNQGAATDAPAPLLACIYADEKHFCSRTISAGLLSAGESKWAPVDCFYELANWDSDAPPSCSIPNWSTHGKITKYTAVVDTAERSPADQYFDRHGPVTPIALAAECGHEFGCIREVDETNNRKTFEGLDLIRIEGGKIRR